MDIQRINPREWNCNAAVFGDLVFCSGMVADDKSLDMKGQTAQVLKRSMRCWPRRDEQIAHPKRDGLHAGCAVEGRNERIVDGVGRPFETYPPGPPLGADLTPGTMVEITVCAAK